MHGKARRHLERALAKGFGTGSKTGTEREDGDGRRYVDLTDVKEYSRILRIAIVYQPGSDLYQRIRNSGEPPLITRGERTKENGFRTGFRDRVMSRLGGPESPVEIQRDFKLTIRMDDTGWHTSLVLFYIQHTNELIEDEKTHICTCLREAFLNAVLISSETEFECKYENPRVSYTGTSWFPREATEIHQGRSGEWFYAADD